MLIGGIGLIDKIYVSDLNIRLCVYRCIRRRHPVFALSFRLGTPHKLVARASIPFGGA